LRISLIHLLVAFLGNQHVRTAAVVQNVDITGLEFGRFIEREAGCIGVACAKLNYTEPHESLSVARIETNLALQRLSSSRKIIRTVTRYTQKKVCSPKPGLQNDRPIEGYERFVDVPLLESRQSKIEESRSGSVVEGGGLSKISGCSHCPWRISCVPC
jgi:hypothetical protein